MEFEGIVSQILEQVKGQSARGEWSKQEVIFEYPDNNFGRKICVGFWNDRAPRAAALRIGERVQISINVESREHNGRWYTEARGWKIEQPRPAAPADQQAQPTTPSPYPAYSNPTAVPANSATAAAATNTPAAEGVDDLPF